MEKEYLEIKKLEKLNLKQEIKEQIIQKLWKMVKNEQDIYEIRGRYKEILEELDKYDNNYYSFICIILNVMKSKKEDLKNIKQPITIEKLKYIKQRIAGEVSMSTKNHTVITRYITKAVEYEKISYPEGIGENNTKKILEVLLKEAEVIISEEKLDLERAKKWVREYKEYVILTYGRWSKNYEIYMNTAFEIPVILTTPNILLLAMRETMRKGIKSVINNT